MSTLPDRPEFHFTPTKGWINDPYGLVFRGGVYHLFFQYVPDSVTWAVQLSLGPRNLPRPGELGGTRPGHRPR